MTVPLYQVAAGGHFVTRLGRRCFAFRVAVDMASDLVGRGYVDAHAQRWIEGESLPPFALTLCMANGRGPSQ